MSAPQKIEKIQYKEIIVPKFRDLKLTNGHRCDISPPSSEFLDTEEPSDEDLDDAIFAHRHDLCEIDERARFNIPEKNSIRRKNPERNQPRRNSEMPLQENEPLRQDLADEETKPMMDEFTSDVSQKPAVSKKSSSKSKSSSRNKKSKKNSSVMTSDEQSTNKNKRPRKTPEEIAALYASRTPRPVRTRKSTLRNSPDDRLDS